MSARNGNDKTQKGGGTQGTGGGSGKAQLTIEQKRANVKFMHGAITVGCLIVVMLGLVVGFGTEPQIPLVIGCAVAGVVSFVTGFTWEDMLEGMVKGISQALEAVIILMLIGMLVGVWIASGTVPTLIYYGLGIITPQVFLPASFILCAIVSLILGSWGTAGTIGIAMMGIAAALGISPALTAGTIISGAYFGEVASPIADGPNLSAAIASVDIFKMVRRFLPIMCVILVVTAAIYGIMGAGYAADASVISASVEPLRVALAEQFSIGIVPLIPLVVMFACILLKLPAIPSMLVGAFLGMAVAIFAQGADPSVVFAAANEGFVSETGFETIDTLLTNGGIQSMMSTISIVVLAMGLGGIMQETGQMAALVAPIIARAKSFAALIGVTELTNVFTNFVMPDQYLSIAVPGQMYHETYRQRGIADDVFGNIIGAGGAVTSPLVPWNTCGLYMSTVLGVATLSYAPFALFSILYPVVVFLLALFAGKKLGWSRDIRGDREETREAEGNAVLAAASAQTVGVK